MIGKSHTFTENSFLQCCNIRWVQSEEIKMQYYITRGLSVAFSTGPTLVTSALDLCPESLCPSCVSRCPTETGSHSAVYCEEVLEQKKTMAQNGTVIIPDWPPEPCMQRSAGGPGWSWLQDQSPVVQVKLLNHSSSSPQQETKLAVLLSEVTPQLCSTRHLTWGDIQVWSTNAAGWVTC